MHFSTLHIATISCCQSSLRPHHNRGWRTERMITAQIEVRHVLHSRQKRDSSGHPARPHVLRLVVDRCRTAAEVRDA